MFPIAEDSDRGDASPKSGLPSSAAPMASDSTRCAEFLSNDKNSKSYTIQHKAIIIRWLDIVYLFDKVSLFMQFFEDFLQKSCKSAKNFVSLWSIINQQKI